MEMIPSRSSSLTKFKSDKPKILFLGKPTHDGGEIQKNTDYFEIDILDAENRTEALAKIPHQLFTRGPYEGIVARTNVYPFDPFDEELFAPFMPRLKIVVTGQVGYNDFDVEWMTRQGVYFCNSKYATCEATAEMALFLIFAVLRNTSLGEQSLREGRWRGDLGLGRDPAGLTLGIIGMGKIGEKLAHKASTAFGMRVAYWNKSGRKVSTLQHWAHLTSEYYQCETLDELLGCSDVVSLHCPLTESTTKLMSDREFGKMKPGSFFINTSRGGLVDDSALIKALESGQICRAGLDVFGGEPDSICPYYRERADKVVVQPHMGGLTEASFRKASMECFANLRAFFETGRPLAPLNELPIGTESKALGFKKAPTTHEHRPSTSTPAPSSNLLVAANEPIPAK
ncbi:hypothetical protein N0V93_008864 [Gnomoniopsis smithogilvyi]|uniref:Uncharacterized protein n=1 Tax=Gnomoniopsis smithogilvyi TaxID=1191159 RepID=A0A9W8YJR2_9PEZI|nr:hypothetical protein N0V93_008864 [Gnomoniopsis smithogilvyi]